MATQLNHYLYKSNKNTIKKVLFSMLFLGILQTTVSAYAYTNNGEWPVYKNLTPVPYSNVTSYGRMANQYNQTATSPRKVTIECVDHMPPSQSRYQYDYYTSPSCHSTTGEGNPFESGIELSSGKFSGYENYRCVSYYYNGGCSTYRYDTTYTPTRTQQNNDVYDNRVYSSTISNGTRTYQVSIIQAPVQHLLPKCTKPQAGVSYPTVVVTCTCPDGTVDSANNGGATSCNNSYSRSIQNQYYPAYQYNSNQNYADTNYSNNTYVAPVYDSVRYPTTYTGTTYGTAYSR